MAQDAFELDAHEGFPRRIEYGVLFVELGKPGGDMRVEAVDLHDPVGEKCVTGTVRRMEMDVVLAYLTPYLYSAPRPSRDTLAFTAAR